MAAAFAGGTRLRFGARTPQRERTVRGAFLAALLGGTATTRPATTRAAVAETAPEERPRLRSTPARFIPATFASARTAPPGPPALRLINAHVVGLFGLEGARIEHVVDLLDCTFEQPPDLRMARLVGLRMRGCKVPGLRARNVRVRSDLVLEAGFTSDGVVDLTDATVDGTFRLAGAVLRGGAHALLAARIRVSGSLMAVALRARGEVRLRGADFGGSVHLGGARLINPGHNALEASGVRVAGSLFCDAEGGRFTAEGRVLLDGARVGGNVVLSGARLRASTVERPVLVIPRGTADEAAALVADRIRVDGNVELDDGFTSTGTVRLPNAEIGGYLRLSGARIGQKALVERAVRARAGKAGAGGAGKDDVDVPARAAAELAGPAAGPARVGEDQAGEARADHDRPERRGSAEAGDEPEPGAEDDGLLHIPVALHADGVQVRGDLDARGAAHGAFTGPSARESALLAYGQVRLVDARVRGSASLSGARLVGPGIDVLFADRFKVGGTLFLRDLRAQGSLRLQNAEIGSTLDCSGAVLRDPRRRDDGTAKPSLDARVATVGKDLLCSGGFTAEGGVRLLLAEVGKTATFAGALLGHDPGGTALGARGMTAQQLVLRLDAEQAPRGRVVLTGTRAASVVDGPGLWAAGGGVAVEDFTFGSIASSPDVDVRTRLRWLREVQPDFAPGPYEQLATVYREGGDEELAQVVLVEKQHRRYSELGLAHRAWGFLQRWTVGYGYRPWLAITWLTAFWLFGALWFQWHEMLKLNDDESPVWNPWLLAADLLLPIIDLGQDNRWQFTGVSQWIASALIAVGWILASTAAAGAARVLKRV
ncbi:hypothetical protein CNX65_34850 [Actinosynnema pretiosum]|uniref:Membrane-associated oxidoreductase n=1 Tax=Actinosynnema pretiosum TaxID=42197 RepID=A0A290ZFU9_9PSEU|nr:hypothetical protein CNX65_34850 [Actinosynnema pretiosum]